MTTSQIATKYKITSQSLGKWKIQFLENASLAFDTQSMVIDLSTSNSKKMATPSGETAEHRLVYKIVDNLIVIVQCR